MAQLTHICYVNNVTGVIEGTQIAHPNSPPEGLLAGTTETVVIHIMSDWSFPSGVTNFSEFNLQYYRDFSNGTWKHRGLPSNNFYEWKDMQWVLKEADWLESIRQTRNQKLSDSDWAVLPDTALTADQVTQVVAYRAQLRDIMATVTADVASYVTIDSIPWPTAPSFLA